MVAKKELDKWISKYEKEASKLDHCVTLSALYAIRDRMAGERFSAAAYSLDFPPESTRREIQYGDSEFLRAVSGKDPESAWRVMDELMETLQAVNPSAYAGVMRKLQNR